MFLSFSILILTLFCFSSEMFKATGRIVHLKYVFKKYCGGLYVGVGLDHRKVCLIMPFLLLLSWSERLFFNIYIMWKDFYNCHCQNISVNKDFVFTNPFGLVLQWFSALYGLWPPSRDSQHQWPLLNNKTFCLYFIRMQQVFSALYDVTDKKGPKPQITCNDVTWNFRKRNELFAGQSYHTIKYQKPWSALSLKQNFANGIGLKPKVKMWKCLN